MKKIVEVSEEGSEGLIGERVAIWCECYIYAGTLVGVNTDDILLEDAEIVYETGPLRESGFKDSQKLPSDWYVRTAKIESYGRMKLVAGLDTKNGRGRGRGRNRQEMT